VTDLARSEAWYREVLGLERVHGDVWEVPVMLARGGSGVALFAARPGGEPAVTAPGGMLHLAFRADRAAFEEAQHLLAGRGIAFEFQDHDVAHSIYFSDPDGHLLELTTYDV
jgi:catechol 2,3-dioxygenase-like lactoylglutathione lyase family enzyme